MGTNSDRENRDIILAGSRTTGSKMSTMIDSRFLSLLSHEFYTPLTVIKDFVSILMDGLGGEITAKQKDFLEIVSRNAARMEFLIEDMNDLTRLENGTGIEIRREPVDIRRLVQKVLHDLERPVQSKSLSVRLSLPEFSILINGDTNYLHRAIAHVVGNAVNFTPDSGEILIRIGAGPGSSGPEAFLHVEDNGIGIPAEELPAVKASFTKASNAGSQVAGGLGIGIPVTRAIVSAHQGSLFLQSKEGTGTAIRILLPLHDPENLTLEMIGVTLNRAGLEGIPLELTLLQAESREPLPSSVLDAMNRLAGNLSGRIQLLPAGGPEILLWLSQGDEGTAREIRAVIEQVHSRGIEKGMRVRLRQATFSGCIEEGVDFMKQTRKILSEIAGQGTG